MTFLMQKNYASIINKAHGYYRYLIGSMHDEKTGKRFSEKEHAQMRFFLQQFYELTEAENGTYNAARVRRVTLFGDYEWYFAFRNLWRS